MEIPFTCQIDRGTYLRMTGLHALPGRWWLVGRGALLLAALGVLIVSLTNGGPDTGLLLALALVVLFAAEPFWNPLYKFVTEYQSQPEISLPVPGLVTAQGITFHPGKGTTFYTWEQFKRFKRGRGILLLYLPGDIYYVFARGFFEDEQDWQGFVALVNLRFPSIKLI